MKFNFKALLGTLILLVVSATTMALEIPNFSSTNSPHWYQVKFTTGSHVLKDNGADANLITADAATTNELKWQLIGEQDNFKMRSANGNYIGFGDGRFKAVANESDAVSLRLNEGTDYWEIGRIGQSNYMNQWGGTGVGAQLGEWNSGDNNNKLTFISLSAELPEFSDENATTWYFIQFCNNNSVITSNGIGQNVTRPTTAAPVPTKLWKLVGEKENFQIVNKDGEYLGVSGSGDAARVIASTTAYAPGFSLIESPSTFAGSWEIKANGITGNNNCMNMWQGASSSAMLIGFWAGSASEKGNALRFIDPENVYFAEFDVNGSESYRPENKLSLWYTRPATTSTIAQQWMDLGLPVGNGQLGAMVLGGVKREDISVNEKTLWTGRKEDNSSNYGCYQNFGSLYIESLEEEGMGWEGKAVRNYWRNLDLTDATANVSYQNAEGTTFTRTYIASNPDNVVAALLSADKAGSIYVKFTEAPGMNPAYLTRPVSYGTDGTITYGGKFETLTFAACIKIIPTGGTMTAAEDGITVKGADKVLVVITGGTDYDPLAPNYCSNTGALTSRVETTAGKAADKGWESLLADHIADYQSLFGRVEFEINGSENNKPTDEMINYYQDTTGQNVNANDPAVKMLEQLYFHYGRYLHIGSSRGVDLPNNLQGIWSGYNFKNPYGGQIAPWNADIHNNINLQMCYWPAEPTNLSELHLPFLNYLINMATKQPQWQQYAKDSGQTKGWTFFTESNIFGGSGSFMHNYTIANAWCCSHLFQHYDYTLDKEFLARAFPTIWSTCEFWLERLVKGADGTWEAPREYSPEHGPGSTNATCHAQQILVDLFSNTLRAIEVLGLETCGITADDQAKLQSYYDNLDRGLYLETYDGEWGETFNGIKKGEVMLQEWKYAKYSQGQKSHRHMSNFMCLYPYSQIEPGTELFDAAVNGLEFRGDGATGWSMGWKINLWARAQDGDHARKILRNALCSTHRNGSGVYLNLFDSHSPFQIDGNFGACSGVAEMLLQSRNDAFYLLPALPSLWTEGRVKGLKAIGNVTVDIDWKDGKIKTARMVAVKGGNLKVGNADIEHIRVSVNGVELTKPLITINEQTGTKTIYIEELAPESVIDFVYDADYTNNNTEFTAINTFSDGKMNVSVSNGTIKVSGIEKPSICVSDLNGRTLATARANSVKVPVKNAVIIVKVTSTSGEVYTAKATI
ncbi:MAG: glycoside hydrolase family 95 protein [Clostridium sp.]|nr:glycoside hydrolase family 95 protein [Clostridium sp.]